MTAQTIFIADDHAMMIDGVASLLKGNERFQVTNTALDGQEALEKIINTPPDILITDINMPEISGTELTKKVKERLPGTKVLVLSMHNDNQIVEEIVNSGADGYILKNTGKQELLAALDAITSGKSYFGQEVVNTMMENLRHPEKANANENQFDLTQRETEIIKLIAREYSSAEIAEELFISQRTVETHRKNILKKTGVKNIVGLVKFAFEQGWVD